VGVPTACEVAVTAKPAAINVMSRLLRVMAPPASSMGIEHFSLRWDARTTTLNPVEKCHLHFIRNA
jgi:hypothetical protein